MDEFTRLEVHRSISLAGQEATLQAALAEKRLPGWWLYHSAAQALRWLQYHSAVSPSRSAAQLRALYAQAAEHAATGAPPGPVHVIGLGCGGGQKDAAQLAALARHAHHPLLYAPLDASPALVLQASQAARSAQPGTACHGLALDFTAQPPLQPWLAAQEAAAGCTGATRLFTCYGLLPNLQHRWLLPWLRSLLRPADTLLISANLSPQSLAADQARILPQYDHPLAHRWLLGALEALGLPAAALRLQFRAQPGDGSPGPPAPHSWRIAAHAEALHTLQAQPFEHTTLHLQAGETLQAFHSMRYTLQAFLALLEQAGLHVGQQFLWAQGEEAIAHCSFQ